jgi:glucosamine-6-phosphate deaminase
MKVVRCVSKEQLAYDAAVAGAEAIRQAIRRQGEATIVLAAGASQTAMLGFLARESLDWSNVTAYHLDEYVGIRANQKGSFRKYLKETFVDKVPLKAFNPIYGERNPVAEIRRLNKVLEEVSIDVAFVGIGENGHLAFNDPPADFEIENPFVMVLLDQACRRQQVQEGWFGSVPEVPRKAITMTIQQVMSAKSIICTVPDLRKAKAVKAAAEGRVTPKVPASILQEHPNATVFLDPESSSLLRTTLRPLVHKVADLSLIPRSLSGNLKRFHLLLAADWKKVAEADLGRVALKAMTSGAVSVTAWGQGSFAVKMAFEAEWTRENVAGGAQWTQENVAGGRSGRGVPTTCYKADEVDDALYYYLEDVKETVPGCNGWVAVVIGDPGHRDRILGALADPAAFIEDYTQNVNDSRP